jgi:SSS family solute:Na+ symporter
MSVTFIIVLILVGFAALRTGNSATNDKEYTLAGRSLSSFQVASVIIGTLVGGASTIGTVQLAYEYGIAAWLFTLGSGLACLVLGLFFAKALREQEVVTVTELVGRYFGQKFRYLTSLLTSFGMFMHVIAQYIAAMAVLSALFPLSIMQSATVVAVCFLIIVVRGGMHGSALIGVMKVGFLYLVTAISCILVFIKSQGYNAFLTSLPNGNWWTFADYGNSKAVADIAFMVIGVASTQTYLQAIFSAKSAREAKKGAFIAAGLIPPIGLMGVFIGLFLRANHPELAADSSIALPFFLTTYFGSTVSEMFLAFIFIIILGTGAGLILGVTTNVYNDFINRNNKFIGISGIRIVRICSIAIIIRNCHAGA